MANDLTTQSATAATVPASTVINTVDTGSGHTQAVAFQSATVTNTSTASSATSVQVLAANTARLGATFFNDSSAFCFLKLGTTASATDYTVQMGPDGYYEVPFGYNGRCDAIWVSANGSMRASEFT